MDNNYSVVTEVGTFGDVNIKDPTVRNVEKENDMDELIKQSIKENSQNLANAHN